MAVQWQNVCLIRSNLMLLHWHGLKGLLLGKSSSREMLVTLLIGQKSSVEYYDAIFFYRIGSKRLFKPREEYPILLGKKEVAGSYLSMGIAAIGAQEAARG